MQQPITIALLIALGGFWLTSVARRLPRVEIAAMAGVRPWACNACMSFWSTAPLSGLHFWASGTQVSVQCLAYLAAAGLCLLVLELLNPKPPTIPEFVPKDGFTAP
jgi:hypothetical protein